MRDYEHKAGRLAKLSFHGRLVYTIFLLFSAAGFGVTFALLDDMVGMDLAEMDSYYAGAPQAVDESLEAPPLDDGPMFDLPDDIDEAPAAVPMSTRKLLEVTHFHLFTIPVFLLIVSHLFMLSRARSGSKTFWILTGSAGAAVHVAAPWIATSGGLTAAIVYGTSGIAMTVGFAWMALVPVWEMWWGARALKRRAGAGTPAVARSSGD